MKKRKRGFTLIELIISLTLLVVVIIILYTVFNTSINIINFSNNKSTLQSECQSIEEKISRIGMQSSSIKIEKNRKSDGDYNITLDSLNESGEKENFYIEYTKSNKTLKINKKVYSKNVEDFSITPDEDYENIALFNVSMEFSKGHYRDDASCSFQSSILLRNKE